MRKMDCMTPMMSSGACILVGSLVLAAFQSAIPSPYPGQPLPGLMPTVFAPGIVSTDAVELNGVFTPT